MSQSHTFTREGFPTPNPGAEYQRDEVVWVHIDENLPYWPAQIVIQQKQISTTKGQSQIIIKTFNDPSCSVNINEKKRRKRQKRVLSRSKILKFDALKKNGEKISYEDVINEYVKHKQFSSFEDIDEQTFDEWNEHALPPAEDEHIRLHEQQINDEKRKSEGEQLARSHAEEEAKKNSMKGQIYDGRKGEDKNGFILNAGDTIRYWKIGQMTSQRQLIQTKIIRLYDLYGTLRSKATVPIIVEAGLNPPFWDTEIELLPTKDKNKPILFPLNQCKFIPSQIENQLEIKHMKEAEKWDKKMRKTKFGSMVGNTIFNRNNNNRTKKRNKNKNKNNNRTKNKNKKHSKPKKKRKRKSRNNAKSKKKKRKLNNPKQKLNTIYDLKNQNTTEYINNDDLTPKHIQSNDNKNKKTQNMTQNSNENGNENQRNSGEYAKYSSVLFEDIYSSDFIVLNNI